MENIKKWEIINQEIIFEKYGRKIKKVIYRLPNKKEADYYIIDQGRAVAVVALTVEKKFLLVEQYRPGPNDIMYELPGGIINKGETPIEAAIRELKEETGYEGEPFFVSNVYDDAYSTMIRSCVVIKNCKKKGEQMFDSNEFINIKEENLNNFRKLLRSGKMTDVEVGYLGLDYLNLL